MLVQCWYMLVSTNMRPICRHSTATTTAAGETSEAEQCKSTWGRNRSVPCRLMAFHVTVCILTLQVDLANQIVRGTKATLNSELTEKTWPLSSRPEHLQDDEPGTVVGYQIAAAFK